MENQNGIDSGVKTACNPTECCIEVRDARNEFVRFKEALRDFLACLDRKETVREASCACC
jgi:hypothetical protein